MLCFMFSYLPFPPDAMEKIILLKSHGDIRGGKFCVWKYRLVFYVSYDEQKAFMECRRQIRLVDIFVNSKRLFFAFKRV